MRSFAGRVDGRLDDARMHRAGVSTSLGGRPLVLGLPAFWRVDWLRDAVVDRAHRLATSCHQLSFRLRHALRVAWYVLRRWPDTQRGSSIE